MGWGFSSVMLLLVLAAILVSAGIEDARIREIANWKSVAIALLAPFWWWASGVALWPDVAIQLGVAALVFAVFLGAFAIGQMGGGDVKLIGALALWLPPLPLLMMLMVMALIGGALTLVMMIDHKLRKAKGILEVPYGVAIVLAALLSLREPLFNQFT